MISQMCQKIIVLLLDDYHLISNREIHTLLDLLIEHQPSQLHLVLSSRFDPPLPLAQMACKGILERTAQRRLVIYAQ